jgi:hypothetical protein
VILAYRDQFQKKLNIIRRILINPVQLLPRDREILYNQDALDQDKCLTMSFLGGIELLKLFLLKKITILRLTHGVLGV